MFVLFVSCRVIYSLYIFSLHSNLWPPDFMNSLMFQLCLTLVLVTVEKMSTNYWEGRTNSCAALG